jgi:hypothetical protein
MIMPGSQREGRRSGYGLAALVGLFFIVTCGAAVFAWRRGLGESGIGADLSGERRDASRLDGSGDPVGLAIFVGR